MSKNRGPKRRKPKYEIEFEEDFLSNPPQKQNSRNILDDIKFEIKCKSENQKKLINSIQDNDVTVCIGSAGCGKTFLAVAEALRLLKHGDGKYKKILLTKSMAQLRGHELGTLPGTVHEKLILFMASYMDSFHKLIGEGLTNKLIEMGYIKFEPISMIRGRDFSNCIILADEFQNIEIDNAKTLLTRISENSKLIILGDGDQIDIKNKKDSSLEFILKKMKDNPTEGVGTVEFDDGDIVRHRLTSYFLNLFKPAI